MFVFYSLLLLHITAVLMTFTFCAILHRFYCRIYWFWIFIIILKLMFWILFTCCVLKWNDTRVILPQHHQEIHNTNTRIGIALRRNNVHELGPGGTLHVNFVVCIGLYKYSWSMKMTFSERTSKGVIFSKIYAEFSMKFLVSL